MIKPTKNIYKKEVKTSKSPTESMMIDICSPKLTGDVVHSTKELSHLSSFKSYPGSVGGELNRDHVAKYIVLMYSQDTILNQRPPIELSERKLRAAELAGFSREKSGKFRREIVKKLFFLESTLVVDMIFEFLKYQNNHVWTEICTTEQELDEYTRLRFQPVSDDKDKDTLMAAEKKDKLRESCKRMIKDLKEYYNEFFQDHEDVKSVVKANSVYFAIENLAREL